MKSNRKTPGLWEPVLAVFVLGVIITMVILNAGCASPCRFVGAEWDSRSPEQIVASTPGDSAVFEKAASSDKTESRAFTEWKALFDLISGLRVRLRLVVVESGGEK